MIFEAVTDLEIAGIYPLSYLLKCTPASIIILAWYYRRSSMERYVSHQMPMMTTMPAQQQRKGLQKRIESMSNNMIAEHYNFTIDDVFDNENILGQIG